MSFDDFKYHFQRIYLCRVFKHVINVAIPGPDAGGNTSQFGSVRITSGHAQMPRVASSQATRVAFSQTRESATTSLIKNQEPPWYLHDFASAWFHRSAQGAPTSAFIKNGSRPENNPQWSIRQRAGGTNLPVYALISLVQPTQQNAADYVLMALVVANKQGQRVRTLQKDEIVAGALNFVPTRELTVELELEVEDQLTIFPCTLRPGVECTFTLSIYCKEKLEVFEFSEDDPFS